MAASLIVCLVVLVRKHGISVIFKNYPNIQEPHQNHIESIDQKTNIITLYFILFYYLAFEHLMVKPFNPLVARRGTASLASLTAHHRFIPPFVQFTEHLLGYGKTFE